MKRYLLIAGLCLGATFTFAQKNSIGPFVGINSSWISDYGGDGGDVRNLIGLNAGLKYTYSNYVRFGLGADLAFSQEGVIVKNGGISTKTTLNYVRIPLKVYYFFNNLENPFRPKVYLGPSLGFMTKAKVKSAGVTTDVTDFIQNFDLGIQVGTGFNYKFAPRSWFTFDLNYTHGLSNIVKAESTTSHYNRSVGVTMGLAWGF